MKKTAAFTLIELLVVISIVGILATLVAANLNSARSRARDAQRKSDARSIQTALRLYYNDKGSYPLSNVSNEILGCGAGGVTVCSWGGAWSVGTTSYMPSLPQDPLVSQSYRYSCSDGDSYSISVCLENKSDANGKATADTSWCSSGWMFELAQ